MAALALFRWQSVTSLGGQSPPHLHVHLPVAQAATGEGLLSPQVSHPLQENTRTPESSMMPNNSVSTTPVRTAVTARNIEKRMRPDPEITD